ncbi:hypothetical protein J8N05_04345 [Streptomyces sp. BH-SS-21]|uniref:Uncharacterized protein n=1 Tax=Streptomyces liliiviolaceus TaxID=2823109 RepID=A0A940XNE3_9ACTN|nr:DUF5677 domain-containing protein [Streptomyces liliiviolaceus]MBQ0847457.1 hypothetical protein [Streptomyces liliiviolaceus]
MTKVEQDNARAITGLEALTELLESGVATFAPASEDQRPFLVGWGLLAALHGQASAVVLLHRKGFGHEAAPNRRLMIEYMAQLQWLARDGEEAVDSLNKAFQHTQEKLRKAIDQGNTFSYDAEVAASADAVAAAVITPNTANQYANTSKLLNSLATKGLLEVWLSETQLSHSGLTTAQAFRDDSSEVVRLLARPEYGKASDPSERSPLMACLLLHLGMQAFNDLMAGQPWTADLDRIGREAGLVDDESPLDS